MDFIEKLCGISPDGGSGSFELTLCLIPLLSLALAAWARLTLKHRRAKE